MAKIVIDAGHGGTDPGAVHEGRREADDNLALALAVGDILKKNGVDVVFTRTEDVYQTPYQKAQISNQENPDFLISFHRNSSPEDNQYSGVETLVFHNSGEKVQMAEAINRQLAKAGFRNLGVKERPGLVILRRSTSPALLVETGFINTDADNELFDERFEEIAQAIADGILETLRGQSTSGASENSGEENPGTGNPGTGNPGTGNTGTGNTGTGNTDMENTGMGAGNAGQEEVLYRVQTGAFRNQQYAQDMLYQLTGQGYPAFILQDGDLYKVQVGAFRNLDNAIKMEAALRSRGYSTYIST